MERTERTASRRRDAIVVLGCRIDANGRLSDAALRRAKGAREAFFAGSAPLIVASGGKRWAGGLEAAAIASRLATLGVPRDAIRQELSSLTTTENAAYSIALLRRILDRAPSIVVVTCAWHLPRAVESFARHGIDVEGKGVHAPASTLWATAWRKTREATSTLLDRAAYVRAGVAFSRYRAAHLDASADVERE